MTHEHFRSPLGFYAPKIAPVVREIASAVVVDVSGRDASAHSQPGLAKVPTVHLRRGAIQGLIWVAEEPDIGVVEEHVLFATDELCGRV